MPKSKLMPKGKFMRIILIVGSVLIIIGALLMGWVLAAEDEHDVIEVRLEGGKTESLAFKDLTLVPGEECEYTVQLKKTSASKCDLELEFVDLDREMTLKHFARVRIVASGKVIFNELLADALEGEKIVLPVDFDAGKNTELRIVYYLPLEVGNEAKNAVAAFQLLLTASNE